MSLVKFVPVEKEGYCLGWPKKLLGGESISLSLWDVASGSDNDGHWLTSIYKDQFENEYILEDYAAGQWEVNVTDELDMEIFLSLQKHLRSSKELQVRTSKPEEVRECK